MPRNPLAARPCIPCTGDVPKLTPDEMKPLFEQLEGGWEIIAHHHLEKTFRFPDFQTGLDFVNRAGAVAEAAGHHPDLHLAWGRVRVTIWTHAIDGLHEADFILAAKIDEAAESPD